jgi:hypothetical protein
MATTGDILHRGGCNLWITTTKNMHNSCEYLSLGLTNLGAIQTMSYPLVKIEESECSDVRAKNSLSRALARTTHNPWEISTIG